MFFVKTYWSISTLNGDAGITDLNHNPKLNNRIQIPF